MSIIIDGFLFCIGVALFCITLAVAPTLITLIYYLLKEIIKGLFRLPKAIFLSLFGWMLAGRNRVQPPRDIVTIRQVPKDEL